MAIMPIYLNKDLHARLDKIAKITGVPKSALMVISVNHCLILGNFHVNKIPTTSGGGRVVMSLRMPDKLKGMITDAAASLSVSASALVNMCAECCYNDYFCKYADATEKINKD